MVKDKLHLYFKQILNKLSYKQKSILDIFLIIYCIGMPIIFYILVLKSSSSNFFLDYGINIPFFIVLFLILFLPPF